MNNEIFVAAECLSYVAILWVQKYNSSTTATMCICSNAYFTFSEHG